VSMATNGEWNSSNSDSSMGKTSDCEAMSGTKSSSVSNSSNCQSRMSNSESSMSNGEAGMSNSNRASGNSNWGRDGMADNFRGDMRDLGVSDGLSVCCGADLARDSLLDGVADLSWDRVAHLSGYRVTLLPGDRVTDLSGYRVTLLPGDGVADFLGDWHALLNLSWDGDLNGDASGDRFGDADSLLCWLGGGDADLLHVLDTDFLGDAARDGLALLSCDWDAHLVGYWDAFLTRDWVTHLLGYGNTDWLGHGVADLARNGTGGLDGHLATLPLSGLLAVGGMVVAGGSNGDRSSSDGNGSSGHGNGGSSNSSHWSNMGRVPVAADESGSKRRVDNGSGGNSWSSNCSNGNNSIGDMSGHMCLHRCVGVGAVLGDDVLALLHKGGVDHGLSDSCALLLGLSVALLGGDGVALLVGHQVAGLAGLVMALLLHNRVAHLLRNFLHLNMALGEVVSCAVLGGNLDSHFVTLLFGVGLAFLLGPDVGDSLSLTLLAGDGVAGLVSDSGAGRLGDGVASLVCDSGTGWLCDGVADRLGDSFTGGAGDDFLYSVAVSGSLNWPSNGMANMANSTPELLAITVSISFGFSFSFAFYNTSVGQANQTEENCSLSHVVAASTG